MQILVLLHEVGGLAPLIQVLQCDSVVELGAGCQVAAQGDVITVDQCADMVRVSGKTLFVKSSGASTFVNPTINLARLDKPSIFSS